MVYDIIFRSTNQDFCEEFGKMMASEFESLVTFLVFKSSKRRIVHLLSQGKYIKDILKKFGMDESKAISTPLGTNGNWDMMQVATWWIKSCIGL